MASGLISPLSSPESLAALPAFAPLAPWLSRLPSFANGHLPGCDELNVLFDAMPSGPLCTANGHRLRCVSPDALRDQADEAYEARVWRCGEIGTRPDNWHDLFIALTWCAFPEAKRVMNAHHAARIAAQAARTNATDHTNARGTARDVLTLFDEDGIVVPCSMPELGQLLRDFRWKELFVERRDDLRRHMDFCIVGHALYDKMRAPFFGVTGKALLIAVDEAYFAGPAAVRAARLDNLVAGCLRDPLFLESTRNLSPLPVLGIPGWCADNETPSYYDDTRQFRPGRRGMGR